MEKKEIAISNEKYLLRKSKFLALVGRRRIGKTFLVRNLFEGKFTFKLTGLALLNLSEQLANMEAFKLKLKNRSLSGFLLII